MSEIIYGPQGCGKTRNAEALMKHFGLKYLIDGEGAQSGNSWKPGDPIPEDTLILTNIPHIEGALDFYEVKAAIEGKSETLAMNQSVGVLEQDENTD